MEEPEGFTDLSESICLSHIIDRVLADLVLSEADSRECSYCPQSAGEEEPASAVSMNVVGRLVFEAATWLYHDGYDEFFHEGYQEQYDTDYVVASVSAGVFDPSISSNVEADIGEAIATPSWWVDAALHEDFLFSWQSFADTVKYQSRFVYVGARERQGRRNEPPARVSQFLDGLGTYVQDDMLTEFSSGEKIYRARMVEDGFLFLSEASKDPALNLGPAPAGKASAGRLNPEGVGLFYGATTAEVAVKETALHSLYDEAVVGGFRTQRPLLILDFTKRPALPSIFDQGKRREFLFARFADDFVERLTQSVRLTGEERVEYVATQIIGEYFRWAPTRKLDGIAWESHLLSPGEDGKNVLVWASSDDVRSDPPAVRDTSNAEMRHSAFGAYTPTLTLSSSDVSVYRAKRFVAVKGPILPGDDDPSPMFMNG
ncbi:RES domain-containing protein [Salinibacterium sp. SWN248]|uniref:RES domain-containing protein n=1 Tax=Salinibacterium sp. SWN248 TaxID=2792056 RepID=UPI0018CE7758|nr:RES domain-containing protein [Salinibacterium sp. SWN248]MBH0024431.1 RES domain-containing protein [Salinibacterium sp. SWN248]